MEMKTMVAYEKPRGSGDWKCYHCLLINDNGGTKQSDILYPPEEMKKHLEGHKHDIKDITVEGCEMYAKLHKPKEG